MAESMLKDCDITEPHGAHVWHQNSGLENSPEHVMYGCFGVLQPESKYGAYWQEIFDNIPQEAVDAFEEAWAAKRKEIGRGIAPKGIKTRAGLSAALKALYELQVL